MRLGHVAGQIVLLVVGFLLTTVVGGFLSYLYQRRSWHAQRLDEQRDAAMNVFQDISRTLDKRLYCMRRVDWALARGEAGETLEKAWDPYRQIVVDWNENINRNLALVQAYFGQEARDRLDARLTEEFKRIGALLETAYRRRRDGEERHISLARELDNLSDAVYDFNVLLINSVLAGKVGHYSEKGSPYR